MPSCLAARDSRRALLGAQVVVAGVLEREVEGVLVVAGVVLHAGRGVVREGLVRHVIAPADLRRIEAGLGGEDVHRALDRLDRLRAAGAAVGDDRRRVRDDRGSGDLDPRDRVRADRAPVREHRQDRADRGVGAGVLQQLEAHGEHLAVASAADRDLLALRAAVAKGEHVLAAQLRPAHRALQLAGEPGDEHVLGRQTDLRAEAAADVRRDHAHLLRFETERPGQRVARAVGRLRGRPDSEPAVGLRARHGHAALHRAGGESLAVLREGGDDVAAVEQARVRILHRELRAHVGAKVGEEQRLAAQRDRRVRGRGQVVELHLDELRRVRSLQALLGDHDGDDLTCVTDHVARHDRARHPLVDAGEAGRHRRDVDVRRGERERARYLRHGARVDARDARVRRIGADERDVQCAGDVDVVAEGRRAGDEPRVLGALDPISEDAHGRTLSGARPHRGGGAECGWA